MRLRSTIGASLSLAFWVVSCLYRWFVAKVALNAGILIKSSQNFIAGEIILIGALAHPKAQLVVKLTVGIGKNGAIHFQPDGPGACGGGAIQPELRDLRSAVHRIAGRAVDLGHMMRQAAPIGKRTAYAYPRIRNTMRFLLANLEGFDPARHRVTADDMIALDQWAVGRAYALQREIALAYDDYNFHLIYQKLLNFCVADLGGFYLDVIKDRQYTTQVDSLARRSCQTAMFHIVEAMVRWMAPVLSFTADEVWGFMPGQRAESVFMETWYDGLVEASDTVLDSAGWQQVLAVKTAVAKQLEAMRKDGTIGSSLDAEVTLYCDEALHASLAKLENKLLGEIDGHFRLRDRLESLRGHYDFIIIDHQDIWHVYSPNNCTKVNGKPQNP